MPEHHPSTWTNASVLKFSGDRDPIQAVTDRARQVVTHALDAGWSGPPFDPLGLADLLSIQAVAREDVLDARTVPDPAGRPLIEYNPIRPRGRVRYSLAHEIAHTMFEDWAERVRHRSPHRGLDEDEWQLEALCNIAAAEFVMPIGSFRDLAASALSIDALVDEQKRFDVSMEAMLIRTVHLREDGCAMFCASRIEEGTLAGRYRIDYLISSREWDVRQVIRGILLPKSTSVAQCVAIGYSAKGNERWAGGPILRVECIGIAPYPGSKAPRVVGVLQPPDGNAPTHAGRIEYVIGDATIPRGEGRMLVHVVPDSALTWGGGGFAAAVRKAWPTTQEAFRTWARAGTKNLRLGNVHVAEAVEGFSVASIVGQHGHGASERPRIRYEALLRGLQEVAEIAGQTHSAVQMPRIGCGIAGGSWDIVEELIQLTLLKAGIPVTVCDRPGPVSYRARSDSLPLFTESQP